MLHALACPTYPEESCSCVHSSACFLAPARAVSSLLLSCSSGVQQVVTWLACVKYSRPSVQRGTSFLHYMTCSCKVQGCRTMPDQGKKCSAHPPPACLGWELLVPLPAPAMPISWSIGRRAVALGHTIEGGPCTGFCAFSTPPLRTPRCRSRPRCTPGSGRACPCWPWCRRTARST